MSQDDIICYFRPIVHFKYGVLEKKQPNFFVGMHLTVAWPTGRTSTEMVVKQ
jgi:hypothetical protein